MSNIVWLVLSWLIIAIGCYYVVFVLGRQSNTTTTVEEDDERKKKEIQKNLQTPNGNSHIGSSGGSSNNGIKNYVGVGGTDATQLINAIISWIHNYSGIRFATLQNELITAFDDASKRLLHDEKFDLRFEKNELEAGQFEAPEISNFVLTDGPPNQLAAHAQVVMKRATLKLLVSKQKNDRYLVNSYEALLSNIHAEVDIRLAQIADHPHLVICFCEAPKSEIILYDTQLGRISGPEANQIHDLVNKSIGASIVNLKLNSLLDPEGGLNYQTDATVNDAVKRLYRSTENAARQSVKNTPAAKLLRVNVVRAYDLKIHDQKETPFVVVEMDEPLQRHITSLGQTSSPNWDETFEFDLSKGSDEILFEVYNPAKQHSTSEENTFLGLAIVGVNELSQTHNPVQYLKLQSRPYQNDVVHGTLLVQFDFSSDPRAAQIGSNSSHIQFNQPDGSHLSQTVTESVRPLTGALGNLHDNYNFEPITTKTTTITVKGVQKTEQPNNGISSKLDAFTGYDIHDDSYANAHLEGIGAIVGNSNMVTTTVTEMNQQRRQHSEDPPSQQTIITRNSTSQGPGSPGHRVNHLGQSYSVEPASPQRFMDATNSPNYNQKSQHFNFDQTEQAYTTRPLANRRSDSEKRKRNRSFFGDLKDRLSRKRASYTRSKSADPAGAQTFHEASESCPPSRDQSREPYNGEFDDHARFAGDDSKCTLVLELQRSGEPKYFLIPPSIAREPAATGILKKGKKLHLCKDHTFVAVKSTGGIVCNACNGKIASGFNKQAYQCRACRLVCHKSCHTHIQTNCHQNNSLKLSLAKDVDWAHYLSHSRIGEYISAENL
uniref:C2 domain-containing protein n=1 Tax=Panagrellus redivivus TaxID=6233 RepID=A0A7E4V827_PANRE